jgi:hypothetical protein
MNAIRYVAFLAFLITAVLVGLTRCGYPPEPINCASNRFYSCRDDGIGSSWARCAETAAPVSLESILHTVDVQGEFHPTDWWLTTCDDERRPLGLTR